MGTVARAWKEESLPKGNAKDRANTFPQLARIRFRDVPERLAEEIRSTVAETLDRSGSNPRSPPRRLGRFSDPMQRTEQGCGRPASFRTSASGCSVRHSLRRLVPLMVRGTTVCQITRPLTGNS